MIKFWTIISGLLVGVWLAVVAITAAVMFHDENVVLDTARSYGWNFEPPVRTGDVLSIATWVASTWISPLGAALGIGGALITRSRQAPWLLPLLAGAVHILLLLLCSPMIVWKLSH